VREIPGGEDGECDRGHRQREDRDARAERERPERQASRGWRRVVMPGRRGGRVEDAIDGVRRRLRRSGLGCNRRGGFGSRWGQWDARYSSRGLEGLDSTGWRSAGEQGLGRSVTNALGVEEWQWGVGSFRAQDIGHRMIR